jgi:predicted metal-dependent hydrolase
VTDAEALALPAYVVRESPRARRVRLTVTPRDGLVVVVPRRFPRRRVPAIVEARRAWIERALERIRPHREALAAEAGSVPERVEFTALSQVWCVERRPTAASGVRVRDDGRGTLVLTGGVADGEACRAALRRWCARVAREALPRLLARLSAEEGLPYANVTVRGQRTRWGSCSAAGRISLNRTLVFLPPELVRHVLLHELVHTRCLDHSSRFRSLLRERAPHADQHERQLREAWRYVPGWAPRVGIRADK